MPIAADQVSVIVPQDLERLRADDRGVVITLRSGGVVVLHPSVVRLAFYEVSRPPSSSPTPQPSRVPLSAQPTGGGEVGMGEGATVPPGPMSERSSSSASNGGLGLFGAVFVLFLGLKLAGIGPVARWSWWWVTSPLWGPMAVGFGILAAVAMVAGLVAVVGSFRR